MAKVLTEEGKMIHANAERYIQLRAGKSLMSTNPIIQRLKKNSIHELQNEFLRGEITELLENSKRVVQECDEAMIIFKNRSEYLNSDIKVARFIHNRLIERYTRLLNWESVFEK